MKKRGKSKKTARAVVANCGVAAATAQSQTPESKTTNIAADSSDSYAYGLFRKFPKSLAKDLQTFLILSPVHNLSANHMQISVHIVKSVGFWRKRLEVWATMTDAYYQSSQIKLLEVAVTKENVLKLKSTQANNVTHTMLSTKKYSDLRDEVCTAAVDLLEEEYAQSQQSHIRKTFNSK